MFWVGTVWGADSTQGCKYGSTTQGKYLRPPKCTLRNGSNSKLHVVYIHHSERMTEKKKTEERGNPGLLEASVNLEAANPSAAEPGPMCRHPDCLGQASPISLARQLCRGS